MGSASLHNFLHLAWSKAPSGVTLTCHMFSHLVHLTFPWLTVLPIWNQWQKSEQIRAGWVCLGLGIESSTSARSCPHLLLSTCPTLSTSATHLPLPWNTSLLLYLSLRCALLPWASGRVVHQQWGTQQCGLALGGTRARSLVPHDVPPMCFGSEWNLLVSLSFQSLLFSLSAFLKILQQFKIHITLDCHPICHSGSGSALAEASPLGTAQFLSSHTKGGGGKLIVEL